MQGSEVGSQDGVTREIASGMAMSDVQTANKSATSVCISDWTKVELGWQRDEPAAMCLSTLI